MEKNFFEELKWRGLIQNYTPEINKILKEKKIVGYIGFDPTSDSLHVGSLLQIFLLKFFQKHGHSPIALIGGATGMIGDPSGKKNERKFLTEEGLKKNLAGLKRQLEKFLVFEKIENKAQIANNFDWTKELSIIDFLRKIGKFINVSYMISKESVKTRLETGISFTEFSYQLLQAYDFYYLNKNNNCLLQMGGSDQWGNMTSGKELIRKKSGLDAHVITSPLITKSDGTKFGKSAEGENIWLDKEKTSPYKFYQFWINSSDKEAEKLIKYFSLKDKNFILNLIEEHKKNPHKRLLQKELASSLTELVHSKKDLEDAINSSNILFGKSNKNQLNSIPKKNFLDVFEGVDTFIYKLNKLNSGINILDFLQETNIYNSKNESKRAIKANSFSINKEKIKDINLKINSSFIIQGNYIIIQKSKKNFNLIKLI